MTKGDRHVYSYDNLPKFFGAAGFADSTALRRRVLPTPAHETLLHLAPEFFDSGRFGAYKYTSVHFAHPEAPVPETETPLEELIALAAEKRVAGEKWQAVADEVKRHVFCQRLTLVR